MKTQESRKEPKVFIASVCYFTSVLKPVHFLITLFDAAVMETDGFEYLKENCPLLQSELLKTVAGCEEGRSGEGKSQSVLARFSDVDDTNDQSVRRQTWENGEERNRSIWIQLSDGDASGRSPRQEG